MNWLGDIIQTYVNEDDTVLDLGCGIMQATDGLRCKSVLGCDIWPAYLNHIKTKYPTVLIPMDQTDRFMDESFDVVLCLDVVEHLEYHLALKVLWECKRMARRLVIIYTPREFDNNIKSVSDSWGMGPNKHQEHLCFVSPSDLKSESYTVTHPNDEGSLAIFVK